MCGASIPCPEKAVEFNFCQLCHKGGAGIFPLLFTFTFLQKTISCGAVRPVNTKKIKFFQRGFLFFLAFLLLLLGGGLFTFYCQQVRQSSDLAPLSDSYSLNAAERALEGSGELRANSSSGGKGTREGREIAEGVTGSLEVGPKQVGAREISSGTGRGEETSALAPEEDKPLIGVAVVGKDGELLFGPAQVRVDPKGRWGLTPLGALVATGLPCELAPGWNAFVTAVAGQRNQGSAGWMYKVNEEVPMVGADKKQLRAGDRVIWWYSRSIDTPPPVWEELMHQYVTR